MRPVILASASARRRELLEGLGLSFTVSAPDIDESARSSAHPRDIVTELASRKADAVSCGSPGSLVIAADTIVTLDGAVLEKPSDEEDAFRMLRLLSGREHIVYTGLAVTDGAKKILRAVSTSVTFRKLRDDEIRRYIKTGEPMDKAGAYGIQRIGGIFVERIDGDYFNVVGLPLSALYDILQQEFRIELLV